MFFEIFAFFSLTALDNFVPYVMSNLIMRTCFRQTRVLSFFSVADYNVVCRSHYCLTCYTGFLFIGIQYTL